MSGGQMGRGRNKSKGKAAVKSNIGTDPTSTISTKTGTNTVAPPPPRASRQRGGSRVSPETQTRIKEREALEADNCTRVRYETTSKRVQTRRGLRFRRTTRRVESQCTVVSNGISFDADSQNNGIGANVLNDYLNVQYNIVLSIVPENSVIDIQAAIPVAESTPVESLQRSLQRDGAIVLASTGNAFHDDAVVVNILEQDLRARKANSTGRVSDNLGFNREADEFSANEAEVRAADFDPTLLKTRHNTVFSVADRNYYNITELTIENFQSPVHSNPMISSMLSGRMVVAEPGGFSFNDDVKKLANRIGYQNINGGRILYRLDISFSGYDPKTGQWVKTIDIDTRKSHRVPFLSYYVIITKFEAQITNTGTVYNIDFAPSGATAFRPEDFNVDSTNVFTGSANTFGGFLTNLEDALENKRREETTEALPREGGLLRTYEFIAPQALLDSTFWARKWAIQKTYISEELDKGATVYTGKNIDVITVLQSAMNDIPYVQELFIAKADDNDNKQFVRPRTHFTLRFNVIYGKPSKEVGDYYNVHIEVIIEPFVSFKKGSYTIDTIRDYTDLKSQIRRIEQMQNIGSIIRKYDYLNTPTNTEVIDFGINLSSFFYDSVERNQDFPGTKGVGSGATGAQQEENLREIEFRRSAQIQLGTTLTGSEATDNGLETRLGGNADWNNVNNNNMSPYELLGGGKGVTPDQNSYGSTTSEMSTTASRKDRYTREFQDWLSNDQLQLDNLTVRGDPLWLLSPYASADLNRLKPISDVIRPSTDKVIFLNIKAPDQKNYMDPQANKNSNPNVIGGFYGVYSVISTFNNGSFTQQISGYKLNHLNYVEEGLSFDSIIGAKTLSLSESAGFTPGIKQLHPNEFLEQRKLSTGTDIVGDAANAFSSSINDRFSNVLVQRIKKEEDV